MVPILEISGLMMFVFVHDYLETNESAFKMISVLLCFSLSLWLWGREEIMKDLKGTLFLALNRIYINNQNQINK